MYSLQNTPCEVTEVPIAETERTFDRYRCHQILCGTTMLERSDGVFVAFNVISTSDRDPKSMTSIST